MSKFFELPSQPAEDKPSKRGHGLITAIEKKEKYYIRMKSIESEYLDFPISFPVLLQCSKDATLEYVSCAQKFYGWGDKINQDWREYCACYILFKHWARIEDNIISGVLRDE